MAKTHYSPKTKKIERCSGKCAYGEDTPHFRTTAEGNEWLREKAAKENSSVPNSKKKKKNKASEKQESKVTRHVLADGTIEFLNENGELHNPDGPAIVYRDGTEEWARNGLLHREDGPAIIHSDGAEEWYINGEEVPPRKFERTEKAVQIMSRLNRDLNDSNKLTPDKLRVVASRSQGDGEYTAAAAAYAIAGNKLKNCGCDSNGYCHDHHNADSLLRNNINEFSHLDYDAIKEVAVKSEEEGDRTQAAVAYMMAVIKKGVCICDYGYGLCDDHYKADRLLIPSRS